MTDIPSALDIRNGVDKAIAQDRRLIITIDGRPAKWVLGYSIADGWIDCHWDDPPGSCKVVRTPVGDAYAVRRIFGMVEVTSRASRLAAAGLNLVPPERDPRILVRIGIGWLLIFWTLATWGIGAWRGWW